MELANVKKLKNLYLTVAILSSILIVPFLGGYINMIFNALTIAILVITIILIRAESKYKQKKLASIFSLVGTILILVQTLIILIMVIVIATTVASSISGSYSDILDYGDLQMMSRFVGPAVIFNYLEIVLGFIAWGFMVAATVLFWIRFAQVNKVYTMLMSNSVGRPMQPQGGQPVQPMQGQPYQGQQPVQPVQPIQPVAPVAPVQPVTPVEPIAPIEAASETIEVSETADSDSTDDIVIESEFK